MCVSFMNLTKFNRYIMYKYVYFFPNVAYLVY